MTVPFLKTDKALSVLLNGRPVLIPVNHPNFDEVLTGLVSKTISVDRLEELTSIRTFVLRQSFGDVRIEGESVFYKQRKLDGLLVRHLIDAVKAGEQEPLDRLLKFADSLGRNTSMRVRDQLYPFLQKGNNPISANGGFIAFKKVRRDFMDCYTGTIRNAPGDVPSMPREEVDDEPTRTCSHGLHVCNWQYLNSYGGDKVVLCEVMPEHVVAVPSDYQDTKMRTCQYTVIADITGQTYSEVFEGKRYW